VLVDGAERSRQHAEDASEDGGHEQQPQAHADAASHLGVDRHAVPGPAEVSLGQASEPPRVARGHRVAVVQVERIELAFDHRRGGGGGFRPSKLDRGLRELAAST